MNTDENWQVMNTFQCSTNHYLHVSLYIDLQEGNPQQKSIASPPQPNNSTTSSNIKQHNYSLNKVHSPVPSNNRQPSYGLKYVVSG